MAVDGIILSKYVLDLKKDIPFKINKIQQISSNDLLLHLRINKEKKNLIISTHSLYNRLHITDKTYLNESKQTNFITNLKKHLENGTIFNIEQFDKDRYLVMDISNRDHLKDKRHYKLYIELMGKYANVILVNEDNKIIDALKKIPPFENSKRTILPNATYTIVSKQHKKDLSEYQSYDETIPLVSQFDGVSPLLANEINYRLKNNSLKDIVEEIENSNKLYVSKVNDNYQYHVIPLLHLSNNYKEYDLNQGLDEVYFDLEEKQHIKEATNDISKFIKRNIKQQTNKLPKLEASLKDALKSDIYKDQADLIYTYYQNDESGLNSIQIRDYNDDLTTITLDPKLSVKRNAKKLYTKYQKGKKAIEHLNIQIDICKQEILYLNAILEQLELANINDANEIKQELIQNKYLSEKVTHKKKKNQPININTIKYHDHTIYYGKNNIQNDLVTWKLAHKSDTWFHAKDYHGTHVVIDSNNLDEDTIRFCANLAAYYSKGRYSSSVPVNYCEVKNLKKIPKSKLGLVSLSNYKTIYIDPNEEIINKYQKN